MMKPSPGFFDLTLKFIEAFSLQRDLIYHLLGLCVFMLHVVLYVSLTLYIVK